MTQFKALVPAMEVSGISMLSFLEAMGSFAEIAKNILRKNGLVDIKANSWHLQQSWLDSIKQILEHVGHNALYKIGLQVPHNAIWPPDIDSIESGLRSIDIAYHMNHRLNGEILYNEIDQTMKEGIGHYTIDRIEKNKIVMVCNNPYPCDFDKGLIEGVAKKYAPKNVYIFVKEEHPSICRKNNKDYCTFSVMINS